MLVARAVHIRPGWLCGPVAGIVGRAGIVHGMQPLGQLVHLVEFQEQLAACSPWFWYNILRRYITLYY